MEWLDVEKIQYPESDEDKAEYEYPELEWGLDLRFSQRAGVAVNGVFFPNIIKSHEYESEVWRAQCHLPRRNADSTTWKAMPTTIQDARSAWGAEGWQIGMSGNEMKKINRQVMKLNNKRCPQ